MIVVSDTTPLISLLKIDRLDLLEKLFGTVLIPQAVFDELTVDERYRLEADQIKSRQFVRTCIEELQSAGRHIGQKHYQMLLDKLKD